MGNASSRNDHYPVPPGFMPPIYPGYPQFTTPTTWNPFKRSQMRKREKALREYLYTTPMILQYPGAFAVTQPGQNMVQPGIPQVHAAIPIAPVTNGVTNQMSASAPMMVPGAAAPAPGGAAPGATTVIPSQMMPTSFPALGNYATFLDPRDPMGPVVPRRSRRSQRHRRHSTRHRHNNHRRSSSQSSGSSGSGTESPYDGSDYDSGEYSRHHHYGNNPLPRPPKDILSSTPFRPILTQLPSAQYNSWGIGGTVNMPHPQPRSQPQPQPPQPTTYGNIRPRRTRRGLFNSRPRDQYPESSLGAGANHMAPPFMPPTMSMPDAQYAPAQPLGAGPMMPAQGPPVIPTNSPMPMPSPDPAPPPQGGPVIPPGTVIPMMSPAPAGSTPYIGANLGTPRTRGAQTPGPGPPMQMSMSSSPSSGHVPMPTPMGGGGGNMPMPSPAVGTPGLAQAQMAMAPPGSVLVNAAMTMPSPSFGAGGGGSMAPVLKFNGYGEFSGLLYHSPHSVVYEEELYPTALHLFEARKFLDHRPDLADRIRQCDHVEDVTAISAELADFTRRDWGNVALITMDEVLYLKFRQHGELRALLLNTYPADLVYVESGDPFWGDGAGNGMNELGKSLVRVRERIRIEGGA